MVAATLALLIPLALTLLVALSRVGTVAWFPITMVMRLLLLVSLTLALLLLLVLTLALIAFTFTLVLLVLTLVRWLVHTNTPTLGASRQKIVEEVIDFLRSLHFIFEIGIGIEELGLLLATFQLLHLFRSQLTIRISRRQLDIGVT